MPIYRVLLSLHIISVISWMAGILYQFRLFVYHIEEQESVVKNRFAVMEARLSRVIVFPAMVATLAFGLAMLYLQPTLARETWMKLKLSFVVGLILLTHLSIFYRKALAAGVCTKSSRFFRVMNEVPTLLMILIVFLVILRPF